MGGIAVMMFVYEYKKKMDFFHGGSVSYFKSAAALPFFSGLFFIFNNDRQ
jgi:hypothetical protein